MERVYLLDGQRLLIDARIVNLSRQTGSIQFAILKDQCAAPISRMMATVCGTGLRLSNTFCSNSAICLR
jgi:hypothetical protein